MEEIEVAAILRFTLPTSTLDLKVMAEKKLSRFYYIHIAPEDWVNFGQRFKS
jgi:hypothetical protein